MKNAKFILIGLLTLFISSCEKDDELDLSNEDYLIFGHFYSMCSGESCVETFQLTNTKLYEDIGDNYNSGGEGFNFIELGNDKFEQVKDLAKEFPDQLLDEDTDFIGCPDCSDGGGIFIQYSKNGYLNSWSIDQDKNRIPSYLHTFIDQVNEKINQINN